MGKTRKFKSDTGVTIYPESRPEIRVNAGEEYETADEREIEALEGAPGVTEVKAKGTSK